MGFAFWKINFENFDPVGSYKYCFIKRTNMKINKNVIKNLLLEHSKCRFSYRTVIKLVYCIIHLCLAFCCNAVSHKVKIWVSYSRKKYVWSIEQKYGSRKCIKSGVVQLSEKWVSSHRYQCYDAREHWKHFAFLFYWNLCTEPSKSGSKNIYNNPLLLTLWEIELP
jgi:hypothetical protein